MSHYAAEVEYKINPELSHPERTATNISEPPEKPTTTGHENYHGIDTRALPSGADEVYERKVSIMNEALIDLGMGSFQWKIFAMTGFGWFVDNVSLMPFHSVGLSLIL